jgi:hypothetical protein
MATRPELILVAPNDHRSLEHPHRAGGLEPIQAVVLKQIIIAKCLYNKHNRGHQSTVTVEIEVDRSVITDPKQTHTANPTFSQHRNSRKSLDSANNPQYKTIASREM